MSDRETLTRRPPTPRAPKLTRDVIERADLEKLWPQPEFKRFLFTLFARAPMFSGTYGNDGRHLPFAEGRRSLGYDILRTLETIEMSALAHILAEEEHTQTEATHAKTVYDRLSELDRDGGRVPSVVSELLEYPADAI